MNEHTNWGTAANDAEQIEMWMQQDAPAADSLTADDVLAAWIARVVITDYNTYGSRAATMFDFGHTVMAMEAGTQPWPQVMETVRRGIAVLNGYLLVANGRVPTWQDAPVHNEMIVSRMFGAGYLAMQEMHRTYSLLTVPTGDLITISQAAEIIYRENTQYHRIQVAEDIRDGFLQRFVAKTENNPQKATRVSTRQVLALLYERKS